MNIGVDYLFFAIAAFLLTVAFTFLVRRLANRLGVTDKPTGGRKLHAKPIPLLGGLAIFFSFFLVVGWARFFTPYLHQQIVGRQILAVFAGAAILMLGGWLDDRYDLKPKWQIIFPLLAALAVLAGGVSLTKITNPFGNAIALDAFKMGGRLILVDLLVFGWLMGMMYTTKLLDGLDGLTTGLTAIGGAMIFFLAISQKFYQPDIALLAICFAGANLGFLLFNFHPARIFLGEGGSLMAGFILGFLAIVAGGKIATTLLVMGIPALDVLAVLVRRVWQKKSPFQADSGHLHYRLLDLGLSQRKTVLLYYCLAVGFGVLTLFLQSKQKLIALFVLSLLVLIFLCQNFLSNKR